MSRSKALETILVLICALGVGYWVTKNGWWLVAAAVLAFIGLFIPVLAEKIHWAWMKLAMTMGFVMSKVVLTVVYLFFLVPFAFLSRVFRKNSSVQTKSGASSYYKTRDVEYTAKSMENVW